MEYHLIFKLRNFFRVYKKIVKNGFFIVKNLSKMDKRTRQIFHISTNNPYTSFKIRQYGSARLTANGKALKKIRRQTKQDVCRFFQSFCWIWVDVGWFLWIFVDFGGFWCIWLDFRWFLWILVDFNGFLWIF